MVDQLTLQTISIALTGLTLSIAAIYYMLTLRYTRMNMKNTLETRQAQFMMQLNENMTNVEVWKNHIELMNMEWTDLDDFEKKWGTGGNLEAAAKRFNMWWRIGFLGNLLKRNLVDREWLYDTFSSVIIFQWLKWEPIILQSRKSLSNPRYGDTVEYLAKEMMKMDEQKSIKRIAPKTLSYEDAHIGKIEPSKTD